MMKPLPVLIGTLAVLLVGVALLLQRQQVERLRAENAALRAQAAELASRPDSSLNAATPPADADPARLREQQAELLRLRGEVTRLRNEMRQSAARASAASPPPAARAANSPSGAAPSAFTATATVSLRNGESFATGGWLTSPGTRTFLLATPTLGDGASDRKLVNIAMSLLKVAEGDLPEALLGKLQGQPSVESPVLTGSEVTFLTDRLNLDGGTNVVSRPRIATADGVPARLFIGETKPNPDGTQRQVGTMINLSPELGPDGQTITMGVNLEYTPPEPETGGEAPTSAN